MATEVESQIEVFEKERKRLQARKEECHQKIAEIRARAVGEIYELDTECQKRKAEVLTRAEQTIKELKAQTSSDEMLDGIMKLAIQNEIQSIKRELRIKGLLT